MELTHSRLVLWVRPGADGAKRREVLDGWYRRELKAAVRPLRERWEARLRVTSSRLLVQRMKTRWGSCGAATGTVRLNLELAKKPPECLEYILVHELVHLIEPSHNRRFTGLMDRYLPNWRFHREELNRLPLAHEEWGY
ncbi:hypothetical protein JCM17961_41580 [Endothiovibrio diazotrophicus]